MQRRISPSEQPGQGGGTTSIYRPRQREFRAEVLTSLGWIEGTFVLPHLQSIVDYLHVSGNIIKVTKTLLPHRPEAAPFFALLRSATVLIAPVGDDAVETEGSSGITAPLYVSCLFPTGTLDGRLDFTVNLRLSDFLRQQPGFLVVRNAHWRPFPGLDARDAMTRGPFPRVLVNTELLVGIEETGTRLNDGHPGSLT